MRSRLGSKMTVPKFTVLCDQDLLKILTRVIQWAGGRITNLQQREEGWIMTIKKDKA